MTLLTLFLVAVALGTDAFTVAVGIGLAGIRWQQAAALSSTVLVFHVIMPLIGYFAGATAGRLLGSYAPAVGAVVLIFLGLRMIKEGLGQPGEGKKPASKTQPRLALNAGGMLVLGASLSMDALGVGFGLGALALDSLPFVAGSIGVVAGAMTATGLVLGRYLGRHLGDKAVLIGGGALILIGLKMLI